jgi:cytochrome c556
MAQGDKTIQWLLWRPANMSKRSIFSAVLTAALLGMACLPASAGVIEDRKVNFKANNASMRTIGGALGAGDFATIAAEAQKIADWAAVMPDYFPEGSGTGDTSARPAIWENFEGFTAAAKANHDATLILLAAAEAGDVNAAKSALGEVGGTCKACHQQFKGW